MRTRLTVFAAHVDNESQGIADANWSSHSSSSGPVTVSDFHVALRRLQGEDYGISRGDPGRRWVRKRQEECVSVISRAVRPTSRQQDSTDVRHYRRYYVNASRETFHRVRVIGGFRRWLTSRERYENDFEALIDMTLRTVSTLEARRRRFHDIAIISTLYFKKG